MEVTVKWRIVLPDMTTKQEFADAASISLQRLNDLHTSFRESNINIHRNLRHNIEQDQFEADVLQWLQRVLTAEDIQRIYGRVNPEYPPALVMYRIAQYFKQQDCEKIARVNRAARRHGQIEARLTPGIGRNHASPSPIGDPNDDLIEDLDIDVDYEEDDPLDHCSFLDISNHDLDYGLSSLRIEDYYLDDLANDSTLIQVPDASGSTSTSFPNPEPSNPGPAFYSSPFLEHLSPTPDAAGPAGNGPSSQPPLLSSFESPNPCPAFYSPQFSELISSTFTPDTTSSSAFDSLSFPMPFPATPYYAGTASSAFDSSPFPEPITSAPYHTGTSSSAFNSSPFPVPLLPTPGPASNRTIAFNQLTLLIECATSLQSRIQQWEYQPEEFRTKLASQYEQLLQAIGMTVQTSSIITKPTENPAEKPNDKYLQFHVRIRRDLQSIRHILECGNPEFQNIWGSEATNIELALPFSLVNLNQERLFVVAAGPSGGGKTHSMIRSNPHDMPLIQNLLLQALELHGTVKVSVNHLRARCTIVVPFQVASDKGKGPAHPVIKECLSTPADILEFVGTLQIMGITANNGVNHLSSRWHLLIDAYSGSKLVFSVLDLCGDESSTIRGGSLIEQESCRMQRIKESNEIANDLILLRTLLLQLDLTSVMRLPREKERRLKGITGRGSALTIAFLLRLILVPKVHVIMFGDGADTAGFTRSLNVWKPSAGQVHGGVTRGGRGLGRGRGFGRRIGSSAPWWKQMETSKRQRL